MRILELERDIGTSSYDKVAVELWDCSGDQQFDACWAAMMKGAAGVVLMYNCDASAQQEREAELWHEWFVRNNNLPDRKCLVFAHSYEASSRRSDVPKGLSRCQVEQTSFRDQKGIKRAFDSFIESLDVGGGGDHK